MADLQWNRLKRGGMFTQNLHRSAILGGWLLRRGGRVAFVPDPEHDWRAVTAIDAGEVILTGDAGALRRIRVPRGWVLLPEVLYVDDPEHAWHGRWERLSPAAPFHRSAVPGGWLVALEASLDAGFVADPEHAWDGTSTHLPPVAEDLTGALTVDGD